MLEGIIDVFCEIVEGAVAEVLGIVGEVVVVHNIDKGAAVASNCGCKISLRFFGDGVMVGKIVDGAVVENTLADGGGVVEEPGFAFDEIADHIAGEQARIVEGEQCVCQVVQLLSDLSSQVTD